MDQFLATEPRDRAADHAVVGPQQLTPPGVAELRGDPGRTDDVGEQDGREPPPRRRRVLRPEQEHLDGRQQRLDVAGVEREGLGAVELDDAGTGDVVGEVAAELDAVVACFPAVQHQGRRSDARQHVADVDGRDPAVERRGGTGGHGQPLEAEEPATEVLVVGQGGCGQAEDVGGHAPVLLPPADELLGRVRRHADRVVVGPLPPGERVDQHQCGTRSGKVAARSIAIGPPSASPMTATSSAPAASSTATASSIPCSSVGGSTRRHRVRHAGAALVEADDPCERRQAPEVRRQSGGVPHHVEVAEPARDEQDRRRALTEHLVGHVPGRRRHEPRRRDLRHRRARLRGRVSSVAGCAHGVERPRGDPGVRVAYPSVTGSVTGGSLVAGETQRSEPQPAYQYRQTTTASSAGPYGGSPPSHTEPAGTAPRMRSVTASDHCWMLSACAPGTNPPISDSQTSGVQQPDDHRVAGEHREQQEQRAVGHAGDGRADGVAEASRSAVPARISPATRSGRPRRPSRCRRDDELRRRDREAADGLGEQVDDRAVVDLRADRAGAGDQPEQRDERRPARTRRAGRRSAPGRADQPADHAAEQEQQRGQREQQQRAAPAEQAAGGELGDGRVHGATR